MRRALCAGALALGVLTLTYVPSHAEDPSDLTRLSLEELMGAEVVSINVLGTHIHTAGQFMFGFDYMNMHMSRNLDGTRRVSDNELFKKYFTAPNQMTMENFMGMVMYAPTDDLTLKASIPYIKKTMSHLTMDGIRFDERSEDFGDLQVGALYTLFSVR